MKAGIFALLLFVDLGAGAQVVNFAMEVVPLSADPIAVQFAGKGNPHYTHADYQGSIIAVTDSAGVVVQTTNYYPYGEPWREPTGQPMLFGGKERTSLADYHFDPRNYVASGIHWTAPDKKAHDYTPLSPYTYCGGNPIVFIDLDGNDIYKFDTSGHIIAQFVDTERDQVHVVNGDETVIGPTFEYGTILDIVDLLTEKGNPITGLSVKGDTETRDIFRFLAANTDVEYSAFLLDDNQIDLIVTSHSADSEDGAKIIFDNAILNNTMVRGHIHNHPSGLLGFSPGDAKLYNRIWSTPGFESVDFFVYVKPINKGDKARAIKYSYFLRVGKAY